MEISHSPLLTYPCFAALGALCEKAALHDTFLPRSAMAGNAGFPLISAPDKHFAMPFEVAAFYQFAALPDFRELREPLRALCAGHELKGSVLLAHEGINGTLAGNHDGVAAFVNDLAQGELFGGRLDNFELKFSQATAMPFRRLKVRLKKEIVTLGDAAADPTRHVGTYVDPADWNDLIS